jgi:site-specific DNA recombinase
MKSTIKYAVYARKSSESEDRQVQSIDAQLHELKKLAEKMDLKVVKTFEESKSAKTPYLREQFAELIRQINAGEINGVLCWQFSRLSRNPAESGMIQQLLQDEKIQSIQTYDREYKPDDNALLLSVEGGLSNQFIMDLRKNVKRGIAAKVRSGGISGLAMAGYLNRQTRYKKWVEPDPERYDLLRKAFDMYLTGEYSVPKVLEALTSWGYITPVRNKIGGRPLSRGSMYRILQNPRYAGKIPDPYEGGFVVAQAQYQPMITEEEYDRIQDLLGAKGRPRLTESKRFALRGLIRCGECGCMITAEEHKKKLADGTVNVHRYYHCTRKKPCSQKASIREQDLFSQVEELLDKFELSPKLYEWGMEALGEMAEKEIAERNGIQESQFSTINEIETQLDRLLDMAVKGVIDSKEYDNKSKSLKNALKDYQSKQAETAERTKNWFEYVGKTLHTLTNANAKFVIGDLADKAAILLAIGEKPILLDRTLGITPNKWLIPVGENAKILRAEQEKGRTANDKIRKASEEAQKSTWYPRTDSNRRHPVPKTGALIH